MAEDRVTRDPQLAYLGWMVELDQHDIGRWPVKDGPFRLSETPPYIGGVGHRAGPSYGQDNHDVLSRILGLRPAEIEALIADGIVEDVERRRA